VIAVNDGKIVAIGHSASLGRYIELQDANGNTYTYGQLGSIANVFPVPKPVKITAKEIASELSSKPAPTPTAPASAGSQPLTQHRRRRDREVTLTSATSTVKAVIAKTATLKPAAALAKPAAAAKSAAAAVPAGSPKERLFANPSRARDRMRRVGRRRSMTRPTRSRASRTTSQTRCTSRVTSTRCSPYGSGRPSSRARSSDTSAPAPRASPRTCCS
jgi:hypothetical protein